MSRKTIVERVSKICSLADCPRKGKPLKIIIYADGTYRGGHYFGKIADGEEYWECPTCYWLRND